MTDQAGTGTDAGSEVRTAGIVAPYLLVTNIPLHRDGQGCWWGNPGWVKDVHHHLHDMTDLTLLCPRLRDRPPDWVPLQSSRLRVSGVSAQGRNWFLRLPFIYRQVDARVREARIVHTVVVGWPFPLGWLAAASCRRRGRQLVIVLESTPWRIGDGVRASTLARLKACLYEKMARLCAGWADLLIVTQPAYLAFARPGQRTLINPASWIDESFVLSAAEAEQAWDRKQQRFLFAGWLAEGKGVRLLLDALCQLGEQAPCVDIIGDGPLLDQCREVASRMRGRVRVLEPVPYGLDFLQLLDGYSALLVPSVSDEQPRVIFDACARAVPVLGSTASGIASCVKDGSEGWLFAGGSIAALADLLRRAAADPGSLRRMGFNALELARTYTHAEMHRQRNRVLRELVDDRDSPAHA